jgi:hypothetical protein
MDTQNSTQEQLNKLIEFRQTIYDQILTARRDAQFESLDALLLKGRVASFPWLSTAGCFQRKWPSLYDGIEQGQQDVAGLQPFLVGQVAKTGIQFWSLDGSAWPRLQARTLPERAYVYAPGRGFKGKPVVPGYTYSFLDWVPQAGESWSLSVDVERVRPASSDLLVGAAQLKRLCQARAGLTDLLDIVAGDCKYSRPEFLRAVQPLPCGKVARLAKHRVLYGRPKPTGTPGRPRKHGARFAFKEPETWGEPLEELALDHPKWGQVKLCRWANLHGRSAADVEFDVVQAQVHLERDQPPAPLWLPPETIPPTVTFNLATIWRAYDHRWPIEPGNRFRKQTLNWTRPQFQTPEAGDRWTTLVTLAFWQLYLTRPLVADCPLPWQPKQANLTPARVQQGWVDIFLQIGQPSHPPKRAENPRAGLKVSGDDANSATQWSKSRSHRQNRPKKRPETRLVRFKFNAWLRPG